MGSRLARLSCLERRLLGQALVALPLTALSLRWFGLKRVQGWLARRVPVPQPCPQDAVCGEWAQTAAAMVQAAALRGPYRATCLERSLVLWWLLRRAGIAADLMIGVQKTGGRLAAHAWVACAGVPLNDAPDIAERFPPFPSPITGLPLVD